MKNLNRQTASPETLAVGKQRSYNEVIEFLDSNWRPNTDTNLIAMKKLDQAFGSIAQKTNAILVAGTNGKSLTIDFATQLLRVEGLNVGSFYTPHMLTYNERFAINTELISNKTFTDIANDVINMVETLELTPNSFEILTMMALIYFNQNNVDVALLEVDGGSACPVSICTPKIAAITRVTTDEENASKESIEEILSIVKENTYVVSADQSKLNLQIMHDIVNEKQATWSMPIRKLAPLAYPYEQLHGRCAALAERISSTYVNSFSNKDAIVVSGTLLSKQKGQRGRPTIEAKRQLELNPKKTIDQFWKETQHSLPNRFQLLDKEKPSILLDNASNLDAFKNLLLGIRLLHYQRPLKGLTLIIGCNNSALDLTEFLKLLRYFFKKTSGQVILCPVEHVPGHTDVGTWDVEKATNDIKSMKIKAKSAKNFKEAFETAQKMVDERNGLVVVTGSSSIISEYWRYRGIKKLDR
ncbi:tetrahydrofolate synthase [Candidatus Dependentiae bacterium Noda2021]|nr:tetrahydrofolate synthase [Candidatus Dependentiae bacterium Noda2021]